VAVVIGGTTKVPVVGALAGLAGAEFIGAGVGAGVIVGGGIVGEATVPVAFCGGDIVRLAFAFEVCPPPKNPLIYPSLENNIYISILKQIKK